MTESNKQDERSELNLWARQWRDECIHKARAELRRRHEAWQCLQGRDTDYARSLKVARDVAAQVLAVWEASPVDLPPLDAALATQAQQGEVAAPKFPTMLRKMWSSGEVQAWIDANWPVTPSAPARQAALTDERIEEVIAAMMDPAGRVPMLKVFRALLAEAALTIGEPAALLATTLAGRGGEDAKDAARYRWLRSCGGALDQRKYLDSYDEIVPEKLDAAIDAAMALPKEPTHD